METKAAADDSATYRKRRRVNKTLINVRFNLLITINPSFRLITASVNETILKHVSASGVKVAQLFCADEYKRAT